jgi:hypothetical protein
MAEATISVKYFVEDEDAASFWFYQPSVPRVGEEMTLTKRDFKTQQTIETLFYIVTRVNWAYTLDVGYDKWPDRSLFVEVFLKPKREDE